MTIELITCPTFVATFPLHPLYNKSIHSSYIGIPVGIETDPQDPELDIDLGVRIFNPYEEHL